MSTTTAVAVRNGHATQAAALAIRPGQEFWTDRQRAALSALGIKDATNGDLAVFMHYCQKTGLDPFSRQIYLIGRRENVGGQWVAKQTIQVGIDGFRVIRDRIERREGVTVEYEDTVWYDADGSEHTVWLWEHAPAACKVVVVKNGRRFPGVVRTASYMATKDGKPVSQWRTQPDHMIEKCAEAFALRRAFPNDLGGVYLEDEMPPAPAVASARLTAADITATTAPAAPQRDEGVAAATPAASNPAAKREPAAQQPSSGTPQAGKAATEKLDRLLRSLQLGTDEDVNTLLTWLCGAPYDGSRSHCQLVTGVLEDHLQAVGGDTAEAASAIWQQYRKATSTQDGEPNG